MESAGGTEDLPRWTAEGCAPAATSTTWPLCGTSPDCYWCRFKKQKSSHLFVSFDVNVTSSGSSVRCTKIDGLNNVDFVSSNANSSGQEALLYIFEDKEAVIKIIIKGRSPTMRHASRTHRVPLISLNVQLTRTVKPVTLANSANSSEWNNDDKWSSQVRKSGDMSGTSTGKPVPNKWVTDIEMDSDTAAETTILSVHDHS